MTCPGKRAAGAQAGPRAPLGERVPSLPFVWWAIGLALTAGFGLGMMLFLARALGWPIGPWYVAAIQAHGHVQLFGWAGMFALGVGLYFLPRLRGSPGPEPVAVGVAAWLLGGGLALRAIAQPPAAALAPGAARTVVSGWLGLSGLLELAGASLAVWALASAGAQGPPLASRGGLVAVLPFALAFFASLLLGLAANALLLLGAIASGEALIPGGADWLLVHLGLVGMLVPISAAISARTFPLYLRLRVPAQQELYLVFGVLLLGFVLRSAALLDLPDALARLPTIGALLEGIALLALAAVLDVPLRRSRRTPAGREAPAAPEYRAGEWLIVPAYAWLAVAGLLLLAEALSAWGLLARPPIDAERHALGAGLVTLLILGMAVRLLPGFAGRKLHSAGLVWATVWLGNAAALLRVAPLLLPPLPATGGLLALSGSLAVAAVACLGWNLWRTLSGPDRSGPVG